MKKKRIWPILAIFLGVLFSSIGGIFVWAYLLEAYIERIGDPDQSLLFWYLPFLFFGMCALITGIVSVSWGIIRLKNIQKDAM